MTDLFTETWGDGARVVLVHGSLATGGEEWQAQRSLADAGFQLVVPDRRGYGRSPTAAGEDFERDADDVAALMGDGAHLVGHSYGGLAVLVAAARRPDATRSLVVLEPPAFVSGAQDPAVSGLVGALRSLWDAELPDDEWLTRFLGAVGTDAAALPPGALDAALPLVPVLRRGRPPWDADLPLADLAAAPFPKLVVSGGHSAAFDGACSGLAARIGGSWEVIEGAGHEIQLVGGPVNERLLALWRSAGPGSGGAPTS